VAEPILPPTAELPIRAAGEELLPRFAGQELLDRLMYMEMRSRPGSGCDPRKHDLFVATHLPLPSGRVIGRAQRLMKATSVEHQQAKCLGLFCSAARARMGTWLVRALS